MRVKRIPLRRRPAGLIGSAIRLIGSTALPLALVAGLLSAAPAAAEEPVTAPPTAGYVIPPTDRGRVVQLWKDGGPGIKAAAEVALTGSDDDVKRFLEQAEVIAVEDDRVAAAQMGSVGGPNLQEAAHKAFTGTPADAKAFLAEGWKAPFDEDQRVKVAQIIDTAGPMEQEKGRAALKGSKYDVEAFLREGRHTWREEDQRVQVAQILSVGGENVRAAGRIALRGSSDEIRDFLEVEQHTARAADEEHATVAQLAQQVREAGRQAKEESTAAKVESDRAVKAAADAKKAAETAAQETKDAQADAVKAGAAASRAAEYAKQAASASQQAIASARAATSAARIASNAAAQAASAAASAAKAATRANNAAADAATNAFGAKKAREAAQEARDIAKAVRGIAEVSAQAEASANAAGDAALAAVGAALNSLAAGQAAKDAGDSADTAGASSAQARAAAETARRHAEEAKRAATRAAALAKKAAAEARNSRLAAESAALHAENAAKAADDAADHAGVAADAAAKSTAHANAAATAATVATNAVDQAKKVYALAREIEAEGLTGRLNAGLEHATDLRAQEEQRRKDKAQAAQQTKDLTAEATALSADAAKPGADVQAIAAKARKVALKTAQTQGDWSQVAAEVALAGSDTEINQYARTGWKEAAQHDERALVARMAEDAGAASVRTAAEQALKGNTQAVTAFLTTGQYQVGTDEFGVHIAQIIDGLPKDSILLEAGRKALASGDVSKYREFIETGQYAARVEDEHVSAAKLAATGGPELAAAARIAVHTSDAALHEFIQNGQYRAQRKDLLAANHQERVQALIAESAEIAATAHQDAAEAGKVAALARDKSDEANGYAQQAAASATQAKTFADQAAASARKAKEAADRAAQSAKTARDAAARANKAAESASQSAADAAISAQSARTSASIAWAAAARAKDSSIAAGKDFEAAYQASKEARDTYIEKWWQNEERRRNDPGEQARRQYRCGFAGTDCMSDKEYAYWCIKKPACMILTETGEALQPYDDDIRFISHELLGLSNFYTCFNENDLGACTELGRDLAVSSKMRALRAAGLLLVRSLKGCKCFPPGTRVLMGDGSTRKIEDIKVGDKVRATDPLTGTSAAKTVTRHIATEDDKHFNELTVETGHGPQKVTATFEHPFWSPSAKRWLEARELLPGEQLLTSDGRSVRITANRAYDRHARTYNLTVADLHTYYVLAGRTPVLVHNSNCPGIGRELIDGQVQFHIITGDATGGGHKWPGQPGKSVFPQGWDTDKILDSVADVVTSPNSTWTQQTGRPGALLTNAGDPVRWKIEGVVDGVNIRVIYEPATDKIVTGFPFTP